MELKKTATFAMPPIMEKFDNQFKLKDIFCIAPCSVNLFCSAVVKHDLVN